MIMRVFSILPPAACYLMAAIAVFTTYYLYEGYFAERKVMQLAFASEPPPTLPIDQFTGDSGAFGEVSLLAQVRDDWMQTISVRDENGTQALVINYLVAPDASALGTQALAAVAVPPSKMDGFATWLERSATASSALGQVYRVDGRVIDTPAQGLALEYLAENGLRASENFVVIQPFLHGRDAALSPEPMDYRGYVAGGIVALLFAALGFFRSVEDRAGRQPRVTSSEVMSKLTPMATGMADPDLDLVPPSTISKADPNSPLGRIQARARSGSTDL